MDRIVRSVKSISLVFLLGLMCMASPLYAQKRTITGTVKADNEAIPGASIVEKGTTNGTVSDIEGKFSIAVGDGATLVVSFIGMKTQEVAVNQRSTLDVTLESDVTQLSDVVIVGYSTQERKDLTTSVSSVSAKQLKDIPINSAGQMLTGRLAGVQVTTSEGTPNAQVQIRVRGGGSITQDNTPLYVVDGVQVENALNVIAPQDIASIDVLKDASATAIYGARGANGVIIITTKGGTAQKLTVSYSGFAGMRQVSGNLNVLNPYDFVNYQYERAQGNTTSMNTFTKTYGNYSDLDLYKSVPFKDWQKESFGRNAFQQTNNISIMGGNTKTTANLSITTNQEEGVQIQSDFNRQVINFRVDHKFNSMVRAGATFRYNNTVVNGAGTSSSGSSSTNNLRQSVKYRPFLFPGQTAETYDASYAQETNANSLTLVNPVLLAKATYQRDYQRTYNVTGYVAVDPTPYLSFRSTIGYDSYTERLRNFNDSITSTSMQTGQGLPTASIDSTRRTIINNNNVVTFSLHKLLEGFGKKNKLDVLAGEETYVTQTRTAYVEQHGFPRGTTADQALASMAPYPTIGSPYPNPGKSPKTDISSTLLSFFGRASFARDDKYMAMITMRADGSSKFAEGHQWGYFPSASVAWRLSNEKFFEGLRSTVSNLKLRVSAGQSGNNRIGDFLFLSQFEQYPPYADMSLTSVSKNVFGYGPKRDQSNGGQPTLANANLQWETTFARNVGLDFGFLEGRVTLSVDAYSNSTDHLLVNVPVPTSTGYASQLQNVGSTSNKGVEIQLAGTAIQKNDFQWRASFNISFNTNRVESIDGRQNSFLFNSGWNGTAAPPDYAVIVGQPTGTIWGLVADSYYKVDDFTYDATKKTYTLNAGVPTDQGVTSIAPKPGIIKFKDLNGDGKIDDNDRTNLGSALPTFFGGFNNQFSYKNWDLSVFINFQYGNKILNANKLEFSSGYTVNSNLLSLTNQRFRNVNAEGQVVTDPDALKALNANATLWTPLTTASSFYVNSWAVEDGSFIRINNVTLGYTFPTSVLQKIKIQKLRVYTTVNNLAVFTNYSGYDPDVNTRRASPITPGVDYSAYPRSHLYIIGVNLTF